MLEKSIKKQFTKINNVFFETKDDATFLRIETSLKNLDEISKLSREVSIWLDTQKIEYENYFLDVYSSGTDEILDLSNLSNALEKNIQVILHSEINGHKKYEGKLLSIDPIIIQWNAKGQIRKLTINKSDIKTISLYAKAGK